MFVPLYDENPIKRIRFQFVTLALIIANVAIFFLFQFRDVMAADECALAGMAQTFGVVPIELRGINVDFAECPGLAAANLPFPEPMTLLTYMFLHGDVFHLLGNMIFLWVFGDNVEDAMGHLRYLIFYLACGVAGALLHVALQPGSPQPLIGASAAISGVIAAYLMLHPRVRVWVLLLRVIPLKISALWALGAWVLMNLFYAFFPAEPLVAWWAHVGGMIAGAILILLMRNRGVPLFDRTPAV